MPQFLVILEEGSNEILHIFQERRNRILHIPKLVTELAFDTDYGF